jgi:hypothetical protein
VQRAGFAGEELKEGAEGPDLPAERTDYEECLACH